MNRGFIITFILFFASIVAADHPKKHDLAGDPVETHLCGIDLHSATLDAIEKEYGHATRVEQHGVSYEYYWERADAILYIELYRGEQYSRGFYLQAISVRCRSQEECGQSNVTGTGLGLNLGDNWEKALKLYGKRYISLEDCGMRGIQFEWKDTSALRVEFFENGLVSRLTLLAPE